MSGLRRHATARHAGFAAFCEARMLASWRLARGARQSGLYARCGVRSHTAQDIDAVRNAITERWSNGQTEGQISLKALKQAMYGRAGPELLRRVCCLYGTSAT